MANERYVIEQLSEHLFVVGQAPSPEMPPTADGNLYLIVGDEGCSRWTPGRPLASRSYRPPRPALALPSYRYATFCSLMSIGTMLGAWRSSACGGQRGLLSAGGGGTARVDRPVTRHNP